MTTEKNQLKQTVNRGVVGTKVKQDPNNVTSRTNLLPSRQSSRRILGRAQTLTLNEHELHKRNSKSDGNTGLPPDIQNESWNAGASQKIVYSDPDAAEQRQKILALLADKENDEVTRELAPQVKPMTKASGLDRQRKLRK